jgi:hypothetical protein
VRELACLVSISPATITAWRKSTRYQAYVEIAKLPEFQHDDPLWPYKPDAYTLRAMRDLHRQADPTARRRRSLPRMGSISRS